MKPSEKKLERQENSARAAEVNKTYDGAPEECGNCSAPLASFQYMVDGDLGGTGGWGNWCPDCWNVPGSMIAWGRGQLYKRTADGQWLQVAGFAPERP